METWKPFFFKKIVFWSLKIFKTWLIHSAYKYVVICKSWDRNSLLKTHTEKQISGDKILEISSSRAYTTQNFYFLMSFSSLSLHPNFCMWVQILMCQVSKLCEWPHQKNCVNDQNTFFELVSMIQLARSFHYIFCHPNRA